MSVPESSTFRYKLWQTIRQKQIQTIKQNIRNLYKQPPTRQRQINMDQYPQQKQQQNFKEQISKFLSKNRDNQTSNCHICDNAEYNNIDAFSFEKVVQFMNYQNIICREHQNMLISKVIAIYKQFPQILLQICNYNIELCTLHHLKRSLLLLTQILTTISTYTNSHKMTVNNTNIYKYIKCIFKCALSNNIIDGWVQYRIQQLKNSKINSYKQIGVANVLLNYCKRGLLLVGIFDGKMLMQVVENGDEVDQQVGYHVILNLLQNYIYDPQNNCDKFGQQYITTNLTLPYLIQKTTQHIISHTKISQYSLRTQTIQLQIQILSFIVNMSKKLDQVQIRQVYYYVVDCMESIDQWLGNIRKFVESNAACSQICRDCYTGIVEWRMNVDLGGMEYRGQEEIMDIQL